MIRPDALKKILYRTLLSAAVFLLVSVSTFAITLEQHKSRNTEALSLAEVAEYYIEEEEAGESYVSDLAKYVRANFPASEKIEWYGGTAEASNEWLLQRVSDLEKETDDGVRLPIIREIREYLSTIEYKLKELEQPGAAGRSKDEDKQKLAEILRREEYQKPESKEESVFTRWFREFLEWLEGVFPKPAPASSGSGMEILSIVLRVLFYVGLAALLVLIIIKVAPLLFPHLKRSAKPKKKKRVILGEDIADDETANDIFNEAESLARAGDLRGAIRKGYIALLCELADRKVIGLSRHKTNRDYLRDVRSRRELHPRMKDVTDTFERHWYGYQASSEIDWTRFRDEYNEAIRSV
ncbi:MAG TPA: DUF4129 domain-containing protein [Pyrinomonadaceae bacterium]|nr:DUF4129 domain-containing protein [Pyrinomonadaceae bacterium]